MPWVLLARARTSWDVKTFNLTEIFSVRLWRRVRPCGFKWIHGETGLRREYGSH